eukprot:gene8645-6074_t
MVRRALRATAVNVVQAKGRQGRLISQFLALGDFVFDALKDF